MWQHILHEVALVDTCHVLYGVEAHGVGVHALCYLALDAVEGATADEKDVACVNVHIVLVRMLTASLRWHVYHGAFKQFQQALLHTLATHVAGDAGIVALTGNLVNLVDEDDALLCGLYIIVGHLKQSRQDALNVFAHIASLGKHRGVDNGEGHVEQACDGACQQGFTCAGASHHNDIALFNLYAALVVWLTQTLVVVIHGHREITFCLVLANDIFVKILFYLCRLGHLLQVEVVLAVLLVVTCFGLELKVHRLEYLVALSHTVRADVSVLSCDEQFGIFFWSSAEVTFVHSLSLFL